MAVHTSVQKDRHTEKPPSLAVSWGEKLSYGAGDLACSMVFNFMASYLFYFYTDVSGLAVGVVGTIISTARLVDAFLNPVVGVLSDHTRTRWGKLRPYLLFSAVPLAVATLLVFFIPDAPENTKRIYALGTYLLFCVLYTVCNVPYTALMSSITEDKKHRAHLNMTKFIGASLGSLISMGLAMQLVKLLGKGNEQKGFFSLGVIFAVIVAVLILLSFFGTRERIITVPQRFSLKSLLVTAKKSRPWVILCIGQMCIYMATTAKNSTTLYYAKYYLHNSSIASVLLAMGSVTTIVCAMFLPALVAKVRKKMITQIGLLLFILSCILIYFSGENIALIFLSNLLGAFGASLTGSVSFLILGETIDHSEYATGNRQQGLFTSILMFTTKIGIVFSSGITAAVLSAGGYQADAVQSETALAAIRIDYLLIPIIAATLSFIAFGFYNLDRSYAKINQELQEKRRQG